MRRLSAAGVLVLAMSFAAVAQAQVPVSLELRGGAAFPTEDLADAALNTGAGAGFNVNVRFLPQLAAYAGWDWVRFSTDTPFGGAELDVENTGYVVGLQLEHAVLNNIGGWVRAGALYSHIELEDGDDLIADSGHEFGWEGGAGLSVPFGNRFVFTPGMRYRTLSADLTAEGETIPVDLTYVTAEVGFRMYFGPRPMVSARVR